MKKNKEIKNWTSRESRLELHRSKMKTCSSWSLAFDESFSEMWKKFTESWFWSKNTSNIYYMYAKILIFEMIFRNIWLKTDCKDLEKFSFWTKKPWYEFGCSIGFFFYLNICSICSFLKVAFYFVVVKHKMDVFYKWKKNGENDEYTNI